MATAYQVKKKAIGGYTVTYDCPHCGTALRSSIEEAGSSQTCPTCYKPFVVPGKAEKEQLHARQEQERRAKEEAKRQQEQERAKQKEVAEEEARKYHTEQDARAKQQREYQETHCPYCFEEIKRGVKKCKHCHEILDAQLRAVRLQTDVVRFRPPLDDVVWLVVKFWAASLILAVAGWILVIGFMVLIAAS